MARNRQYYGASDIFSAQAATGASNTIDVTDFRNAVFSLGTASSANMTIKVQGGIGDDAPDFSSAQSATNRWNYIDIAPLDAAGVITDGDTGLAFTGTDGNYLFEVNANGLDWLCLNVTARSAGSVTADLTLTTND